MVTEEQLKLMHGVAVEMKELMLMHGQRDMVPHMTARFREAGWQDLGLENMVEYHNTLVNSMMAAATPGVQETLNSLNQRAVPHSVHTCLADVMYGNHPDVEVGDHLEVVVLHTDGRGIVGHLDDGESMADIEDRYERGDLHDDFATNPASKVREVLTTSWYEDDLVGGAEMATMMQFYAITDGGIHAWDEAEYMGPENKMGGLISDTIEPYFADKEVRDGDPA